MPKETIPDAFGEADVKVGWSEASDVQIGVFAEGRSMFWQFFGQDDNRLSAFGEQIGKMADARLEVDGSVEFAKSVLNYMDSSTGSYAGIWATMNRHGVNRLIKALRRGRDSAFGRDE